MQGVIKVESNYIKKSVLQVSRKYRNKNVNASF